MKLEARIERLEASMTHGRYDYEDRADYQGHVCYVVGPDGSVMDIPSLNGWPDEITFWNTHPPGTKFIRLHRDEVAAVIDGVARIMRFVPTKTTPDVRRAFDELYRDITGEWPGDRKAKL